ncbi:hypothetical protein GBK02_09265 [Dechloromonas sp. TW-R-39-2]|uniref:hypothetical protein n=1 Tax=Dechloromonas sp. TW-R-39-2 TaxID=2654218 RepID=UPI00193C8950|nr:hypothetical protein [Dechloromonas sp. TW-R-39-2]QRM19578.1 hypothetical protein GBK02_09265 [Dechloromonas sp. TW-R-39-2]
MVTRTDDHGAETLNRIKKAANPRIKAASENYHANRNMRLVPKKGHVNRYKPSFQGDVRKKWGVCLKISAGTEPNQKLKHAHHYYNFRSFYQPPPATNAIQ